MGGSQIFDASLSAPKVVDNRLAYMTPEWKDAFKYATALADQLGLEEAIVGGPWNVAFQPGRGAPAAVTFNKLISWSDSSDQGVKYFSGYATYTKTLQSSPSGFGKGASLWIDLGDVKNLAVVTVNGKEVGTVWHALCRVDATTALKVGDNQVSVKVINSWVNRKSAICSRAQQPGTCSAHGRSTGPNRRFFHLAC